MALECGHRSIPTRRAKSGAFGGAEGAIAWFMLRSKPGFDIELDKQLDFVEEVIKPALERVPGVATSGLFGGRERELHVIVDAHALATRGLRLSEVGAALDAEKYLDARELE